MKLLTLLSFQVLVIALLSSPGFAEKRAATLDELIKAIGSLYQKKLYSTRDDGEETEYLRGQLVSGHPVTEVRETVQIPRHHYCLASIPYCVTFYGSVIVQDKLDKLPKPEMKTIRNTDDQLCLRDIVLAPCADFGHVNCYNEIVDVSNLKIPDFCFPGMIELGSTIEIMEKITANTSIHVQMTPTNRPARTRSYGDFVPSQCSQVGYFYNVCDLIQRDNCEPSQNNVDPKKFPCTCDIDPDVYDMDGFQKMVDKVDFFGMGARSGFAVVSGEQGKSCFSFKFIGTVG